MKARKVTVLKEVWTNWDIKAIKEHESADVSQWVNENYQVKQVQVDVVKGKGK